MQQEWYEENGRWYHAWQKGLYMYPHDEVSRFVCCCKQLASPENILTFN